MKPFFCHLLLTGIKVILVNFGAAEDATPTEFKGVYDVDGRLHISLFGTPDGKPLTDGPNDLKFSWSMTGDKIVFFRTPRLTAQVSSWKTTICVINADGRINKEEAGGAPWFDRLDQNQDGVIDAAELERLRKAQGAGGNRGDND